jgi:hypothetical protein
MTAESSPEQQGGAQLGKEATADSDRLRDEIAETREALGETVEALARKTDVKAQFQEKASERREALIATQEQMRQKVVSLGGQARERRAPLTIAGATLAVALVALWLIRKR